MAHYRTVPEAITTMPGGVPYIIVNEAAERFSFYGMRTILTVFMTENLRNAAGELAVMSEKQAQEHYHEFVAAVYFLPLLGAVLSDGFLGKYRTILWLSIVYCLGHLALALDETRVGLTLGLSLIAIGSGGIKPCVTANVGDQFGAKNQHLLSTVYNWFYFAINFGAAISSMLTPVLLHHYGPHVAFGVPGILMGLATIAFWLGRHQYVHVPASGKEFLRELFSNAGLRVLVRLGGMIMFVMMFWAVYDQTGSEWINQAKHMDLDVLGVQIDPSQIQALNPVFIMALMPVFVYGLYPAADRFWRLTPLRKIGVGFFITTIAAAISWWIQIRIDAGEHPTILWQMGNYVILTSAELLVSITCLEFFYTQAPKSMKSVVLGLDLLAVSLGNYLTSLVNRFAGHGGEGEPGGVLAGANYFALFTGIMFVTSLLFIVYASFYHGEAQLQDETPPEVLQTPAA